MSKPGGTIPSTSGHNSSGTKVLLALAAAVIVLYGLSRLSSIVGPVFLALVLTICVYPVKAKLQARGVPIAVATTAMVVTVFAMLAALIAALWVSLVQFSRLLPQFQPQIAAYSSNIRSFLHDLGISDDQVMALVRSVDPQSLLSAAYSLLGGAVNLGSGLVFLMLLLFFMGIDSTYFPAMFDAARSKRPAMVEAMANFAKLSRTFMVMTTVFGAIVAVLNLVLLLVVGVPGAGLWAMLSFVCGFIPFVGFWISLVPAAIMAVLAGGLPALIAVVLFYGVINSLIQSVIQPKFVAGSVNLNMALTFLSVIFWSALLGPLGALMAVPLTLFARAILVDSHPQSAWLRPFLGDVAESRATLRAQRGAAKSLKPAKP
jgi:AI-2 transport protein TqsA